MHETKSERSGYATGLAINGSQVRLPAPALSGSTPCQVVHVHATVAKLDGLCFLVAYQLNSLFIFMIFLFDVQLRNKYDDEV